MTGTAYPETGEALDERNLGEWMLHTVLSDYVKRGLGVTAGGGANEITVDAGAASIAFDDQLFHVPLDSAETVPYATTTGTNFVYVVFDTADGAVSVEVVDAEGAVTAPALLIAEVDGETDAVTVRNGTVSFATLTIDGPTITDSLQNKDYNEAVETITGGSGTQTVDLSLANWHEIEADGNVTIEFQNTTITPPGNSLILYFEDSDGTGPHTITWPGSVIWNADDPKTEIPQNSDLEVTLRTPDGGTTWRASQSGGDFA